MHLAFVWQPWPALVAALGALMVTVGLGLDRHVFGARPKARTNLKKSLGFLRHSAAWTLLYARRLFGYNGGLDH